MRILLPLDVLLVPFWAAPDSAVVPRLCVIAGDISPIDVISHLPVFCEESEVAYVFVSSKVRFLLEDF